MISYEEVYKIVKERLSAKRFKHSEGVVKRALEYAKIYEKNEQEVKLCAIAHDIAKEFSEEENKKFIKKYQIALDDIEIINKNLVHAKIGAAICKEEFGFTEDMVNSIKYHTTGRDNMTLLEKIIYLADATEETRNYEDINYYVRLVKENIDQAVLEVDQWVIKKLLENQKIIHPDSIKCYNYYAKLLHKS